LLQKYLWKIGLFAESGFCAQGNMKQHMLTHKIRDMPQHLFDPKTVRDHEPMRGGSMHPHQPSQHLHHAALLAQPPPPLHMSMPPSMMNCSNSNSSDAVEDKGTSTPTPEPHLSLRSPDLGLKRSPPEDDLPMAKRPSGEFLTFTLIFLLYFIFLFLSLVELTKLRFSYWGREKF